MSYILNALRKSERERQTLKPETIAERIVIHPQSREKPLTVMIGLLVAINVIILGYFLGFADKSENEESATVAAAAPVKVADAGLTEQAPEQKAESREYASKSDSVERPTPVIDRPAIHVTNTAPAQKTTKPVLPVQALPSPSKKPLLDSKEIVKADTADHKNIVKPAIDPVIADNNKASVAVVKEAEVRQQRNLPKKQDDLAFLEEMPLDIQRSVPAMMINVFSYADIPSERFVMIDMIKYMPGQRIKDVLMFKEMLPDAIVVDYKGRRFKIRRP